MAQHHQHANVAQPGSGKPATPPAVVAASANENKGKLISDEAIRLCAYQKWEAAGKPNGDGVQFWLEAEQELVEGKDAKALQRGDSHARHEHEKPEAEKTVKDRHVNVDSHYRDNDRVFQGHGERGHRHGGNG